MTLRFQILAMFFLVQTIWGQEAAYPAWFWTPPSPGWTVVFAMSDQDALSNGAQILTAYSHSEVNGKFQQLYDSELDKNTWENTDYTYAFDAVTAKGLVGALEVKAKYPVNMIIKQNVYLVGPKKSNEPFSTEVIEPSALPRPAWLDQPDDIPKGNNSLLAVGQFTLEGNPGDAWVKAEESAVFNLLQSQILHISQSNTEENHGNQESSAQIDWIKMHYVLENLRVVGRWADSENHLAEVAVSVPRGSIRDLTNTSGR